jgi:hypothetical protein
MSFAPMPSSAKQAPLYPDAQQVKSSQVGCLQETTYRTEASHEQVLAFYDEVLLRDGWEGPALAYKNLLDDGRYELRRITLNGQILDEYWLRISFIGSSAANVRVNIGTNCQRERGINGEEGAETTQKPINILREEYEEALGKWQASGIEEYEISVHTTAHWSSKVVLRVSEKGKRILVVNPTTSAVSTPDPDYASALEDDTVEGMFAYVERFLNEDRVKQSGADTSTNFHMAYTVEFDPKFGYPISISGYPATWQDVVVFDTLWSKQVTDFKILK